MAATVDTESIAYRVGERILEQRTRTEMSQEELAEAAKLSRKTVGRIESGGNTSFANIISISSALGVTPNDLCPEELLKSKDPDFELVHMYSRLNEANQKTVVVVMRSMMEELLKAQ